MQPWRYGYTFHACTHVSKACVGAGMCTHMSVAQPDSVPSVQEIRSDRSVVLHIRGRVELRNHSSIIVHARNTLKLIPRELPKRSSPSKVTGTRAKSTPCDDSRKGARILIVIIVSRIF